MTHAEHNFSGGGVCTSTLGLQNQWGLFPKCFNLKVGAQLKPLSLEILAMSQSRNFNELPVQRVAFISLMMLTNFSIFFVLLLQKRGG